MTAAVPDALADLGRVFVPISPGEKGTTRPRTAETLLEPDDPVLEAYLEAGHNYGIACQDDVAVLDADEPDTLADLVDRLPPTPWQVSGSRASEHYFLRVPGLDEDIPLDDAETGENLGHIKAAEQSYVVGPGSRHPSGNRYGPLRGPDEIATIDEDELRELIEPWRPDDRGRGSDRSSGRHDRDRRHGGAGCCGGDHSDSSGDVDLDVYDVLSSASYPEKTRVEHPFHGSSTGANFMVGERGETFRCWRHGATGSALHLVGIEQEVIECGEWVPGGLSTDTWAEIFEAARDAGYGHLLPDRTAPGDEELPTDADPDDVEHTAVLPNSPATRAATNGWDWTRDARDAPLSIEAARDRTTDAIADAIERADDVLIEALPTTGKSYGSIAAAAETGQQVTIAAGRGRNEQYEQYREWADEHGLSHYTLPAFTADCPTATGEHGDEWADTVRGWYAAGATPKEIHKYGESELGRPLPCQEDGRCPYSAKWEFDPDEYDVLIGHYSHLHNEKVVQGRTVLVDEFPASAYEESLGGEQLARAVSTFLEGRPAIPFDDFADLLEHRDDDARRADALRWFDDNGIERDGLEAFADDGDARAPLAVATILGGVTDDDRGTEWERAELGNADDGRPLGLYNRTKNAVVLLRPPTLDYARHVVGLDGTPTPEMWKTALGRRRLNHRPVLGDDERADYLEDALGLRLVRTTDAVKSYSAGESEIANRVTVDEDAALLEAIADEHGQRPDLITTKRAERVFDDEGVLEDLVGRTKHYGDVKGSNEFADARLGAVLGSRNFGPAFVTKWAAYLDEPVDPRYPGEHLPLEAGVRTDYGDAGNQIRRHMTEHETLQAAMRFGRDGNGAVVYVHTDTLPEWVSTAGDGRVVRTYSDGERQVIEAARSDAIGDEWTTAEIAAHPDVAIGERQVRTHLHRLVDRGVLAVEVDGCGYVWRDDGLHRVTDRGEVELDPVDLDALDDAGSAEVARISSYRWDFRTSAGDGGDATGPPPIDDPAPADPAAPDPAGAGIPPD